MGVQQNGVTPGGILPMASPQPAKVEGDVPSHAGYPPALMARILVAWLPMLFSHPVGVLP